MKLDFAPDGQIIVVTKDSPLERIIPLCLAKLGRSSLVKMSATGRTITRVASIALELTKTNIAKEKLGMKLVIVSTRTLQLESIIMKNTAMEIFIEKGIETHYSDKHKQILDFLRQSS